MADLLSIANRLNDIEIQNDAILSTTLNRRVGQNINYILDRLGVANGTTPPASPITIDRVLDIGNALTMGWQATNLSLDGFTGASDNDIVTINTDFNRPIIFMFKNHTFDSLPLQTTIYRTWNDGAAQSQTLFSLAADNFTDPQPGPAGHIIGNGEAQMLAGNRYSLLEGASLGADGVLPISYGVNYNRLWGVDWNPPQGVAVNYRFLFRNNHTWDDLACDWKYL